MGRGFSAFVDEHQVLLEFKVYCVVAPRATHSQSEAFKQAVTPDS